MLMFKKIVRIVLCVSLVLSLLISASAKQIPKIPTSVPAPSLSAESAVLIDASNNAIIHEKNAHARMAMASTTKIMTALVAAENCDLDKAVSVSADAVGVEGSSIYLYAGEKMTMRDLLSAMLLESANDAAAAIAIEVGGSVEGFCELMNEKAAELGLTDTHFKNPHGLYDEEHYTTAYELSVIASAALCNEDIKEIVSTRKMTITPIEGNTRVLYNHNKMLAMYEGAIGVKTGFTKKSGRCLVSAAERDGLRLISVTLNAPDDWNDHKKMLDLGFDTLESCVLAQKGEVCHKLMVMGGKESHVALLCADTVSVTLPKGSSERILRVTETYNRYEFAPIKVGKTIGSVTFYLDGKKIASAELIAGTEVERNSDSGNIFDKMRNIFN